LRTKLDIGIKEVIRKSKHKKIEDHFIKFPSLERSEKWIRKSNRYRKFTVKNYENDLKNNIIDEDKLLEYISASAPTHVIDGWSFLARAIESTFRNDTYSAIHFGYYAELRAAMALLASQGIGIFNRKHPIICERISKCIQGSTHQIVWPILKHWTSLVRSYNLLEKIIHVEDLPISEWFNICNVTTPARAVGQNWLRTWGIDLEILDVDRTKRNLVSYRPSEFCQPSMPTTQDIISFTHDVWALFEPESNRDFPVLELHLVKKALKNANAIMPSTSEIRNKGIESIKANEIVRFLSNDNDVPLPLKLSEKQSKVEEPYCHLEIISRALLLLFVATVTVRHLLLNAGYTSHNLEFWWKRYGKNRGFWDESNEPEDPKDIWADIRLSLETAKEWINKKNPELATLKGCRSELIEVINDFSCLELIGIWGLLP